MSAEHGGEIDARHQWRAEAEKVLAHGCQVRPDCRWCKEAQRIITLLDALDACTCGTGRVTSPAPTQGGRPVSAPLTQEEREVIRAGLPHMACPKPGELGACGCPDVYEAAERIIADREQAARVELWTALRDEIAATSVYLPTMVGLLRAAEVIGVPDADPEGGEPS